MALGLTPRLFYALCVLATAVNLAPLILVDALPSQDLPNHFAIVATLAREGTDPGWHEWFASRLGVGAYGGFYLLATPLAQLLGAEVACRVVLGLYIVSLPAAVGYCATSASSSAAGRWATLVAFAFVYGDAYLVGFAPFLLGLPLVFACVGFALRSVGTARPSYALVAALCCGSVLAYVLHPLAAACACFGAAIVATVGRASLRPRAATWAALGPCGALLAWFAASPKSGHGASSLPGDAKFDYFLRTPVFVADAGAGWLWFTLASLCATAVAAALVYATAKRLRAGGVELARVPAALRDRPVFVAALCFGLLYWALPYRLGNTVWLDLRLCGIAWLLLVVAVAPAIAETAVAQVFALAFVAVVGCASVAVHVDFDRETAELSEIIDEMEPDRRLLPIVADPSSEAVQPVYAREAWLGYYSPYAHFGSRYHVTKGGVSPLMAFHGELPWIPLAVLPSHYANHFGIADPFNAFRLVGELSNTACWFDYVLVRGPGARMRKVVERSATLVRTRGEFSLYAPTCPTEARPFRAN